MDKEIMQTCNTDERTNEEKLLDQISELQNEVSVNKIFKSSDEKLIERLIAETAELNTRIASLEALLKEREWISVEDRLPEDFGWLLVIDDSLGGTDKQTMAFFEGDNSPRCSHIRWIPLDQRGDPDSMEITHWQPLPEAP